MAVGGTVLSTPGIYNNNIPTAEGQTFHGDHLYAFYQNPQNAKALPIVMLHGAYQSARSWETTPDGREGFQTLFLRRGFPIYLVDQPRRGPRQATARSRQRYEPTPFDQLFFDQFRIGKWPNYFENVQFDRKPETLDQFFRSVTPNTGSYDAAVISDAMSGAGSPRPVLPSCSPTHRAAGSWLADGNQEPQRQSDWGRLRTGQRLHLPGRRTARRDAERGRNLVARDVATRGL